MKEDEYWFAVAYYYGRAIGSDEELREQIPIDCNVRWKDAYDVGVRDFCEIDEGMDA